MDSRDVSRRIRSDVWPRLRNHGFTDFSSRSAWRRGAGIIDVVNFQSFNSYHAEALGVTTHSFCVNLGCYLADIPPTWPPKLKGGLAYPDEAECHFRCRLTRKQVQLGNPEKHVWSIDKAERTLGESIADVNRQLESVALPWFTRLGQREEILRILSEDEEQMNVLWGFGARPSPLRSYLRGYVALSLGDSKLAHEELQCAVKSGCFGGLFRSVDEALARGSQAGGAA